MAYAAVISLKHNIEHLIDPIINAQVTESVHPGYITNIDPQIKHKEVLYFLLDIPMELKWLGNILRKLDGTRNRSIDRSMINALDDEIRNAVWKVEDVLESYVLHRTRLAFQDLGPNDIKQIRYVEQEIVSFRKTVRKLGENYTKGLKRPSPREENDDVVLPTDDSGGKKSTTTVVLSDQIEKIINELVDPHSVLKAVSVFGMAGIGKTHLATEIYNHPIILQRFDLSVWVSVGPQAQMKNVWADVVAQVEHKPKNLYLETNIVKLVELLQRGLLGRRYLIVLDDVWNTEVCGSLIRLLRAQGNRGRVLVTTRLEQVAKDLETNIHKMRFLNNDESWDLLWKNVFAHKSSFPPQLEKAGKKIAEKCEGLPLLILAVADILSGVDKTEEYWHKVAEKKTTTFPDAYDKIYKVLFSSYEYLPQYMKPCFLYMGVFLQSSEIPLSKLINLLSVEDFMEPEMSLTKVFKTSKNAPVKPKLHDSLPSVPKTSEKFDLSNSLTWEKDRRTSTKFDLSNLLSTCRVERAFETLYLLEPGLSPTRFIMPFKKIDQVRQHSPLTKAVMPSRNIDSIRSDWFLEEAFDTVATLEFFIMECAEKLVSNSLAIVCKHSSKFKIKSFKLHSAYWYLCVKEARKNKFFHVLNKLTDVAKDNMESQRRLFVQNNILFGIKEVHHSMASTSSTARSLLCTGEAHEYPVPVCLNLLLLKVLDALAIRFYEFPTQVLKLLQLRYLALTHNGKLPPSISKLQQLQFVILRQHHNIKLLRDPTSLPTEIWDLQQLTHLRIMGSNLPDPSSGAELPNLYTLHMNAHSCTEAVFRSIPYLKKLGIRIELQPDAVQTISCFEHIEILSELESLKCVVVNPRLRSQVVAPPDHLSNLPRGLKKLCLNGLGYSWECMSAIGSLPNLLVLKLRYSAFRGAEWETEVGEFPRLEFLLLEDIDVVHWKTEDDDDGDCFPHLRCLIIRHCYKLKEMPQKIPTLETLEVVDCSPTLVASAQQMEDMNSSLQLLIKSSWNIR